MNFFSFLRRRARYHWLLLLALSFGVVLATTALASGPVLIDAVIQLGLRRTLAEMDTGEKTIFLTARKPSNQVDYQAIDDVAHQFLEDRLGGIQSSVIPSGNVGLMYPWKDDQLVVTYRVTLGFYSTNINELNQNIDLKSGAIPEEFLPTTDTIPVLIGPGLAETLELKAGDRLPVSLSARSSNPEWWLSIEGILDANLSQAAYLANDFGLLTQIQGTDEIINFGVLVDRDAFFELAPKLFPSLTAFYSWQMDLPVDEINIDNLSLWQTRLNTLPQEAQQEDSDLKVKVGLGEILNTFTDQTEPVRTTLIFLNGIVVLVSLYYIVMMATLSLERVRTEFAVLRSRGASKSQIFRLQLLEAVFICVVGAGSGPFLAGLFVRGLSLWGPLSTVADPDWGLNVPQAAWLAASVAIVGSVSSFLLPLPASLRNSIITQKQAETRNTKPPFWQRLYLDVFILIIGLVLVWRFHLYGGILGVPGGSQADYLLLLAPLSLLVGSAAILLRIFPVVLNWGTQLVSNTTGLISILAFWQVARNPKNISRLVLLLMLAMSLGMFSTSLNLVLQQNEEDRSHYFVGSDIRIVSSNNIPLGSSSNEALIKSDAWRTYGAIEFGTTSPYLNILAIEPVSFNQVAHYRSDFAGKPLEELLLEMKTYWDSIDIPPPGLPLPGEPTKVGLWFSLPFTMNNNPDNPELMKNIFFEARLLSSYRETINVPMIFSGQIDGSEDNWYYFEGIVPDLSSDSYPLNLTSIWFRNSAFKLEPRDILWVDDLTVFDRSGGGIQVIDSFDGAGFSGWVSVTNPLRAFPIPSNPHTGTSSMAFTFDSAGMSATRLYGISRVDNTPVYPVPALMSKAFQERTGLAPGDRVTISIRGTSTSDWMDNLLIIVDVVDYFPTMYETEEAGFLVVLQKPILDHFNLYRSIPIHPNERFIATSNSDKDMVGKTFIESPGTHVYSYEEMVKSLKALPLALGLRSGATFGYLLTTVLSLVGVGFNFYLSTSQRTVNYGVLRAIGLSPWQLYGSLLLEQVLLVVSGLTLGTVLGIALNQLTLPGLPIRLGELANIPPTIPRMNWSAVIGIYISLTIGYIVSIGIGTFFLWRMKIHRVIRIGEE